MKVFDWNSERFLAQSKERQEFYKNNHEKLVTEEKFVRTVLSWPRTRPHSSKVRKPGKSKRDYKYLVKTFGFFQ
jgi:hypothetical protein